MLKFQNKIALVTGSGTGIGKAIATKFIEEGASVIILGRRKEPLEEAAKELERKIPQGTNSSVRIFAGVDVADETAMNNMFDTLKNENITIDYIINNAGVSGPVTCFANASLDEFKSTIGIHLTGTFWGSVQALKIMKEGGKIITISTFFTEERPLEQRPYRFRSPYTASQGAKNRLAELMSWELTDKGIISIATNPGPVHSDRIYKTVYPKAAAEFMRVSGFEDLVPTEVDEANRELLPLLGEDENIIKDGIVKAAEKLANGKDVAKLTETFTNLLNKIQTIAEKVQNNTSHMIANREFLSQGQVAESVLNLCDDEIAKIINGKVIPGDRVFYPVKPYIGTTTPGCHQPDFTGKAVVFTIDATDKADAERVEFLAQHVEKNGGKVACFISQSTSTELQEYISGKFHSHVVDIKNPDEVTKWLNTAKTNIGEILGVIHITGKLPEMSKITESSRAEWEALIAKFITTPATVAQRTLEQFVPGGTNDPRLYKDVKGAIMIIGPDLPVGRKVTGTQRGQVEVFRGALRPFTTTVNQELSDVLKSKIRMFTIFPGSVTGSEPNNQRIADAFNFLVSGNAESSSEIVFCVDESR
ncbi:SDR family NAD(P)-dependent oxidoreductase [Nitrosopumilus adriaticus]|uniref:Oxidoreductase, short chain dehydrogenase/reductase family protein n=1 Tax=Nitrosopumilus adriaticus TaxID=1580092 RepID=A0A0D5C1I0_9ARCH|nr:SDR family oxidoreductase [Nitrosopumilus adriaticus]AJW70581.1 Oxidoreductase, short chain dehydrogenase/reductase family protein [Nitrosopumilus adriaticus]